MDIDFNQLKKYQQAFVEYADSVKRQMDSVLPHLETFRKFALEAQKYMSLIPKVNLSVFEGVQKAQEMVISAQKSIK